jgi:hypothetical protein
MSSLFHRAKRGLRQIDLDAGSDNVSTCRRSRETNFERSGDGASTAVAVRRRLQGEKAVRFVCFIAALIAAFALVFMPLTASFGADRLRVVAFGDSLLDAGTYAPFPKATFNGGRFRTNPGWNFTQEIAQHYGDTLTPAFVGGFGQPLVANGGFDYAQGGSRVTMQPGIDHAPPGTKDADFAAATAIPVKDQLSLYLSADGRFTSNQLVPDQWRS